MKTVEDIFSDIVGRAQTSSQSASWDGVWELTRCAAWTGAASSSAAVPPDDALDVPSQMWSSFALDLGCTYFAFTCKGEERRGQRRDADAAGLRRSAFDVLMTPKRAAISLCPEDHNSVKPYQFRAWTKVVELLAAQDCTFTSVENKNAAISPLWKLCGVLVVLDGHWKNVFLHSVEHDERCGNHLLYAPRLDLWRAAGARLLQVRLAEGEERGTV